MEPNPKTQSLELPPLSLYVHLPWCIRKCPYCDFNSHESQSELPEEAYLNALLNDLDLDLAPVQGRVLTSIFFGGGTPSLLSGDFYQRLIEALKHRINFSPEIEITLEANPGASEVQRFADYLNAGINRISIGVQSFSDSHLETLGRVHSSAQAKLALQGLRSVGFDNFNIDLMHGLPDQTIDQALSDLEQAFEFEPTHLSWYQLTIEPNTAFFSRPPDLPKEELLWDIQNEGQRLIGQAGFEQYEVSAYAKPGESSIHNTNYWSFGDYIGIGAGAHSKVTDPTAGEVFRYRKSRLPADYMRARPSYRVAQETIKSIDMPFEFLMNALRLKAGVEQSLYSARTGLAIETLEPVLSRLREQTLMEEGRLQLSQKGYGFINTVLEQFLVE